MVRQFTHNQERAASEVGQHILVAASAGSGKTTVLIERLMRRILNGTSVDRFLVVTFTKLAATEMRTRLEVAIQDQLKDRQLAPDMRKYLQEQLILLPTANISTIDGFALNLIENYYHVIGLDPQFSILADEAERGLLREAVLAEVLEDFYGREDAAFERLVSNFGDAVDDRALSATVLRLADFADARPDGMEWLQQLPEQYADFDELTTSVFYREQLLPLLQRELTQLRQYGQAAQQILAPIESLQKSHETVAMVVSAIQQVHDALSRQVDWDFLRKLFNAIPSGLRLQAKTKTLAEADPAAVEALEEVKPLWEEIHGSKGLRQSLGQQYFLLNHAAWQKLNDQARDLTRTLVRLTAAFQEAFTDKKRAQRQLDFGDLTHLALAILQDEPTQKTLIAQFDEIMIDEYQDVNQLQEALMQALTNGHNLYMVGDVKQSIYGFRQADPSLFAGKYESFAQRDDATRIDLAENFRSHANVTTLTNMIFTQLMDEQLGGVPYLGSAKLVAAADYPATLPSVAEITLIQDDGQTTEDTEEADFEKRQAQYWAMADRIQQLLNTQIYDRRAGSMRTVQFSDIAILSRSKSGWLDLMAILREADIPFEVNGVGNYMKAMETAVILNVLRLLDNPHQDIPLVAVLRSPLVGMDENDLAAIRLLDQQHDFWTALQLSGDERVVTFKKWYTKWHRIAQQQDLSTLIGDILETTHWLDYVGAMAGGAQRQANLQALSAYARQFEQQKQSGLFSFIAYIEQLQKADKDLGEASQEAPSQAVRIMTIHGSKGLEFPIVFLPEIDKAFNLMDLNHPVLMHKSAGVGFDVLLSDDQTQAHTLQKMVVKDALKQQAWAEEMRLFYVALTRAEQQLHLFGTVKANQQGHLDVLAERANSTHGQFLSLADRLLAKSYLDWLYLTLPGVNERPPRVFGSQTPTNAEYQVRKIAKQEVQRFVRQSPVSVADDKVDESVVAHARARLAFQYHNDIATRTAAYQAVSEMKRLFEDPDRMQMATLDTEQTQALWQAELPLPAFMVEDEQRPSSAMLGTATHLILQNWSFHEKADEAAIEALIAQLVVEDLLHEPIANLVNRTVILRFLQSSFAQKIRAHVQSLQREAPFSLLMPAHQVYEDVTDDAPILVHGIIDGYFVDEVAKTVTLFDYKTDFVHQDRAQTALPQLQARYAGQLRLYHMALQQQYPTYQVLPPRLIALSVNQVLEIPIQDPR